MIISLFQDMIIIVVRIYYYFLILDKILNGNIIILVKILNIILERILNIVLNKIDLPENL